jgi:predicted phosphodiesterase
VLPTAWRADAPYARPLQRAGSFRFRVFAVEDTSVQVTWSSLEAGEHTIEAGDTRVVVAANGGPGAVDIAGLRPATTFKVRLDGKVVTKVRTLASPRGALLFKFATFNDMHVGERAFGGLRTIRDQTGDDTPYPERCLRAALQESAHWGARHLVLKGDMTDHNRAKEVDTVARLLRDTGLPANLILGNHDVTRRGVDAVEWFDRRGFRVTTAPEAIDLPGVRLVLVPTARRGHSRGFLDADKRAAAAALVADATTPTFVVIHQPLQRLPFSILWPPGVPRDEAEPFLDALVDASPTVVVASGHSHRNRRRSHGPAVVVQTGSTKDFPGGWTGYAVHEGGIRQVFRRTAEPSVMGWTEQTRRALNGVWPLWSTGRRSWRCFTHPWADPRSAG